MKTLFPRQAKPMRFALHYHYTGDTQYRVWFDLDNSLTRWKRIIFKILKNSQFAKFAKFRMKTHFCLGQIYQQIFWFKLSLHWWYSVPSLVWFGQFLDQMKKKFSKILKNSQFAKFAKFRMKTQLFPRHALTIFFCCTLLLHWWYSIPCLVWFGQLLDPMKKKFFKTLKNSQFAKTAKFRMKNHFFSRQAIPTTFLLYPLITLVILITVFGLIWTTPWPVEKEFF